jgi:FkbM family methyltransferase
VEKSLKNSSKNRVPSSIKGRDDSKKVEADRPAQRRSTFERLLVAYARRFPVRRGKLRIIDRFWQMTLGASDRHRVATLKYGGFQMSCDLSEMLQRQFYFFGTYFLEESLLACWQAMAKGAKVVLDVGANAGIYSLAALAVQSDATIHAFEPTPEIANKLRATAKLNGLDHLYVHEAAVSTRNGTATLRRFRGDFGTNEGMNFISADRADAGGERVQTVSLDEFCEGRSIDYVDLLKVDIQGHEYAALQGAEQLIRAGRINTIFMELNWAQHSNSICPATESVQFLTRSHYLFSKPGKRLNWQPAGDWLRTMNDVIARRVSP